MAIGILTLHLQLPGCTSLKEKRSRIKPVLARLHREFNVSAAEDGFNDRWQETLLVCALVSNDAGFSRQALQTVLRFTEEHFPDLYILEHRIEIL
ncbi:MAG: DUF503 domain-containing protein [Bellilinea sp.]